MDKEQHFERLRASGAEVTNLQKTLQHIRGEQARLDTERVKKLEELKAAREKRMTLMKAAIDAKIPKTQIARALGMDRTNLYKLLEGKDTGEDS